MKKLLLISALIFATNLFSQNMGIGIRFGDPTGISFKKYNDESAIEINFGRTNGFYGRGWYDNHFYDWYADENFNYKEIEYLGHRSKVPLSLQGHYLIQKEISSVENLSWYVGFGAQLRWRKYQYSYRYKVAGDPTWHYENYRTVLDFDFGVDALAGLEYTFEDAPISVFADINLFLEIFDNPFMFWGQGGIGVRYNFGK